MTLADYTFYVEEFMGNIIPSEYFDKYAQRANYLLQRLTLNRVIDSYYEQQFNLAICELAEMLYNNPKSVNSTSESLGDYSVAYKDGSQEVQAYDIALSYLGNTGLLAGGLN
jgi:hypothetical protein